MRVFVLGGTGSIGTAVVPELVTHGHQVLGLARSDQSAKTLQDWGAEVVRGDVTSVDTTWAAAIRNCDALINLVDTFEDDMAEVEEQIANHVLREGWRTKRPLRVLWTGGCWQYGATGDRVATEDDAFDPIGLYERTEQSAERLLTSTGISAAILHPAMVYHRGGGVFERFLEQAQSPRPIDIWGGPDTRWPLVHRDDLAAAYRLLMEQPDLTGHFNVTAEEGVPVGDIVEFIAGHFGHTAGRRIRSVEDVVAEYGSWAEGPTLDQKISSEKLTDTTGWQPEVTSFRASDLFA